MAAVRELVQNARDAVMLMKEVATSDAERAALTLPIQVSLTTTTSPPTLEIVDHGVGMTRKVLTDYLISIAADYWASQFATDYPEVAAKGFKSAGRFGIGFLSVFMLGPEVTVESNRIGGERYQLSLRGVGRRGELRQLSSAIGSGTAVRVKLKPSVVKAITPLDKLVRIYAPTLPHPLSINVDGVQSPIPVGWLKDLAVEEFRTWTFEAVHAMQSRNLARTYEELPWRSVMRVPMFWYGRRGDETEETLWPCGTPEYRQGNDRLIASFRGVGLFCLRGLTIQSVPMPGFLGVIELDSAALDVSRSRTVRADLTSVLESARKAVIPQIVSNLNALVRRGFVLDKIPFIAACVQLYGADALLQSELPWISRMKMPGNLELISSNTFLAALTGSRSAFICFNTGPWTALNAWATAEPPTSADEVAVVLKGAGQPTPGYRPSHEGEHVGCLAEIWPDCNESPLFWVIIGIVSQAWQISPEYLLKQEGWIHRADEVYGRFVRL